MSVVVRRPGWESWALGATRRQTLTVRAPVATIGNRWVTVARGAPVRVRFDTPVDRVSVAGAAVTGRTVTLPTRPRQVRSRSPRPCGRGSDSALPSGSPGFRGRHGRSCSSRRDPNMRANPLAPIRLTFSDARFARCSAAGSRRSCPPRLAGGGGRRPHARLLAVRRRAAVRLRGRRAFPVGACRSPDADRCARTHEQERSTFDRARVVPPPAAAARPGGLPAPRLAAGAGGVAADDARRARRRRRSARRTLRVEVSADARTSCRRSGSPASRTRSRAARS